jgi:carbon storage regulator
MTRWPLDEPCMTKGDRVMLVLSRKEGECIVIGRNIVITVLESRGNRVRLGITAPPDTPINREEVFERLARAERGNSIDDCRQGASFFAEGN